MNQKSVKLKKVSNYKMKMPVDLSRCLPSKLHDRVSTIINVPSAKEDTFEEHKKVTFKDLLIEFDPNILKKMDTENVTEENFAEILEKRHTQSYNLVDAKIEPRLPERTLIPRDVNWLADYTSKKQERIVWQTKLFANNKEIYEKPLFQQTEELIDIAADHFALWLKEMDDESNINKEFVKQLFSIQVEADASKALSVQPKEISVIPHEVSKMLNLPHLSIQNNVVKMSREDKRLRNLKPQMVAFGRSLPRNIRRPKFNEDLFTELYKINCPSELRSLKIVFDSILHLRSTQALVAHLKDNPELPRAKFLIDHNMFDDKSPQKTLKNRQKPLWSHFF